MKNTEKSNFKKNVKRKRKKKTVFSMKNIVKQFSLVCMK